MAPPSEFDLRAALREGEGPGLNPDHVIFAVETQRVRRRNLLLSTVAVVALITGGVVGISQLSGGSDGAGDTSGLRADSAQGGVGASSGGYGSQPGVPAALRPSGTFANLNGGVVYGGAATAAAQSKAVQTISCPTVPHAVTEDRSSVGTSSRAAATTPLFSQSVSLVVVCDYGPTMHAVNLSRQYAARLTLTGTDALVFAASLEHSAKRPTVSCPPRNAPSSTYAVIGVARSGDQAGPTVIANTGCGHAVTNGTAVRYNWSPPQEFARRLDALAPVSAPVRPVPSPTR